MYYKEGLSKVQQPLSTYRCLNSRMVQEGTWDGGGGDREGQVRHES